MSLTTLANVKTQLGISGSTEDDALTLFIRDAAAVIRSYTGQYLGGIISANTLANPTVCTAIGHGLQTGDIIKITGSNCTPTIDGNQTVTRLTDDTFSVVVHVTTAGTAGFYSRVYTEFYAGSGNHQLVLRQRPVQSITSVYEDAGGFYGEPSDSFASGDLLTAGTDYVLKRDGTGTDISRSGILLRLASPWPRASQRIEGLLTSGAVPGIGNIKVTYVAGFHHLPHDIQFAMRKLVNEMRDSRQHGGPVESESLDYYNYTLAKPDAASGRALSDVRSALARYKEVVF